MKKLVLYVVAAAALAGSGVAFTALANPGGEEESAAQTMMAERGFLLDAKLAGMKAALKLTPDQEKLWPAFETAVRDAYKARMDAMMARRQQMMSGPPSPIDMLTHMSDHMAQMSQELKKVADAAKPLYDSLDATQKAHFGPLMRMLRPRGPGGGMGGMMGGGGMMGPMHGPMMMEPKRP
jgi:hypothetical protein